ncbi:MAG: thiamine phosphate synthase [Alphaproteobacteria bacterium]|nr:thiamine phosphate synthase [Alphaproteobacteria bacterium]
MDHKLVAWARAVKSAGRGAGRIPPLWLFTDASRLPDPAASVARLPAGLCGVVFRHDGDPDRAALGRRLAAICRRRRLALVVAGDWRLAAALGAGRHLRGGRGGGGASGGRDGLTTSSAHSAADLVRARRAGVQIAFLSPAFATASHPGAAGLGPPRWCGLARLHARGMAVAALGGVDGRTVRRLVFCRAVGAIAALAQ